MRNILIAPHKYVQGRGILNEAGSHIAVLGKKAAILWDDVVKSIVGDALLGSLSAEGIEVVEIPFGGESSHAEVDRVAAILKESGAEITIAVGGGKALDTGKGAAQVAKTRVVTIPTIASTDTPTSRFTVWYDEDGNCEGFEGWDANPDVVLVDSGVIASGPTRAFIAGMGDALSTLIEAEVAHHKRSPNLAGGNATLVARSIAQLCFNTLLEFGLEAVRCVERNLVTPAVEKVIEANVLMSGMGFESCGVASAHMIANCLPSFFPECKEMMHGEKVGFGIVSQLCLDEEPEMDDVYGIVDFQIAIGLPVTFADLQLTDVTREKLIPLAEVLAGEGSLCHNHPFEVTVDSIIDAMLAADALGTDRKMALGIE